MAHTYIGVDVSKETLEVAWAGKAATQQFPNTPPGRNALLAAIQQGCDPQEVQVVLEPTSTYHLHLVQTLERAGVPYTVINPAKTAGYAQVKGSRGKTDKADAKLLAAFGAEQQPTPSLSPDEAQERLKALRRHKEWLETQAQATRNHLEAAEHSPWTPSAVTRSLRQTLKALERQAQKTLAALDKLVAEDERWQRDVALLDSIPSIAPHTAVLVLSELPAVSRCTSAKQWVAFGGIHPKPKESGKQKTSSLSRAGSASLRAGLYLPAVASMRCNPVIRPLVQRLKAAGKPGKLRVMAAMNKLLHLCFAVLKRGTPFVPSLDPDPSLP